MKAKTTFDEIEWYEADQSVSARRAGDDGALLFHSDMATEKVINATGLFLWQRLDGSKRSIDLSAEVSDRFICAPSSQVKEDVCTFLNELRQEGFAHAYKIPQSSQGPHEIPNLNDAPKSVDISITGNCNQRCAYCFYYDEMVSRPDLPEKEWQTFFDELGKLSVRDVCLSGGEAFIRKDLWNLIDGLIANRMRISINTNGTLITEKTLPEFEKGKRRRRLNGIQVSIDGSCAEVHERSRGEGTFEKALRGLRLLKEAGLPVTARVTINRYNVDDLENIAKLLLEDIGIQRLGTNDAMPMGAGCTNQATILLSPKQQVQAMKTLASLSDRYNGRINAMAGPLAKWRMYQEMEHAKATGEKPSNWKMGYLSACGGVLNKISVCQDGVITPCNLLTNLELGRINVDSIKTIWKTHPILKNLVKRRKTPMSQVPGCAKCEWNAYCNGGCPALAYELTGDIYKANPQDCYVLFQTTTGFSFH